MVHDHDYLGWGNVDPETYMGIYLVVITQVLAIALAAILTGVVATAYTTQVQRRESFNEQQLREVLKDGVVTEEEKAHLKKNRLISVYPTSKSLRSQIRSKKKKGKPRKLSGYTAARSAASARGCGGACCEGARDR